MDSVVSGSLCLLLFSISLNIFHFTFMTYIIQLMHSFEVDIRICQPKNSEHHFQGLTNPDVNRKSFLYDTVSLFLVLFKVFGAIRLLRLVIYVSSSWCHMSPPLCDIGLLCRLLYVSSSLCYMAPPLGAISLLLLVLYISSSWCYISPPLGAISLLLLVL